MVASEQATYTYIGRSACGCVRSAVVDHPTDRKTTAKCLADFVKSGQVVERVTSEMAKELLCFERHPSGSCPHPNACPRSP